MIHCIISNYERFESGFHIIGGNSAQCSCNINYELLNIMDTRCRIDRFVNQRETITNLLMYSKFSEKSSFELNCSSSRDIVIVIRINLQSHVVFRIYSKRVKGRLDRYVLISVCTESVKLTAMHRQTNCDSREPTAEFKYYSWIWKRNFVGVREWRN